MALTPDERSLYAGTLSLDGYGGYGHVVAYEMDRGILAVWETFLVAGPVIALGIPPTP
jgi:hypothetical protein